MAKSRYHTDARTRLLSFFAENADRQFTADALYARFAAPDADKPMAKSTLYRQLYRLCEEGLLQRFDGTDPHTGAPIRYYQTVGKDGDCAAHFHLKCLVCGEIQHLECDKTAALLSHLLSTHRFTVDCGRSILYGVCDHCNDTAPEELEPTPDHRCPCGCGKTKHRVKDYGMVK